MALTALTACGDNGDTTTSGVKNSNVTTTSTPAKTTSKNAGDATTKPVTTTKPTTTEQKPSDTTGEKPSDTTASGDDTTSKKEGGDTPTPSDKAAVTEWVDNNDVTRYEITENADGTVTVNYAKEPASESQDRYGYEGASWANMKADITGIYTGQSKFVIKVKGESGKSFMVKVFDDAAYQKEITFDGQEQEITIDLNNVKDDAEKVIILFGASGLPDVTGTFTILEAYFAD